MEVEFEEVEFVEVEFVEVELVEVEEEVEELEAYTLSEAISTTHGINDGLNKPREPHTECLSKIVSIPDHVG